MRRPQTTLGRGATGGLIAAGVLAFWFLVIDAVRATPFDTPLFVARTIVGLDFAAGPVTLGIYTLLHFGVFMLVGIAVAKLMERAGIRPSLLVGLVVGFLLFDLIFYAGIMISGTDVVSALGWPEVLIGNLIAAIVLLRYLRVTGPAEEDVSLGEILDAHRTIREGLVAGLIGATAVMLWFLVLDVIEGRILFTPAALGSAMFLGARGVAEVSMAATTIIGYTGIHLFAFLLVGLGASAMVEGARRQPPLLLGIVLFFVTLEVLFIGLMAIVAAWLLDAIHWWTIVVGNLIAAGVMGGYLLYEHPELRESLTHDLEEELVSGS